MDAELKSKWIEALRSGQFTQGIGTLCNEAMQHCCLGVLLRVQGVDIIGYWPHPSQRATTRLPDKYQGGLDRDQTLTLSHMNDGTCGRPIKSFAEIADYIEANIPADPVAIPSDHGSGEAG